MRIMRKERQKRTLLVYRYHKIPSFLIKLLRKNCLHVWFFQRSKKLFATYIFPLPPTDPHNISLRMTHSIRLSATQTFDSSHIGWDSRQIASLRKPQTRSVTYFVHKVGYVTFVDPPAFRSFTLLLTYFFERQSTLVEQ